jgi:hypothetical protein
LSRGKHFIERALEYATAREPIVVVAEGLDTVFTGESRLRGSRFRQPQIVEPQVCGDMGLIMAGK